MAALASRLADAGRSLAAGNDRRSLFFTLYAPCVRRIGEELARGGFAHPDDVARVVLALGRRALEGLEATSGAWRQAHALAATDVSDARVLGSAMNAHLTVDLPLSIADARVGDGFGQDLQRLGRLLVLETEVLRESPKDANEERLGDIYDALPLVPGLEGAAGAPFVRNRAYSVLLAEAVTQGRLLEAVPAASALLSLSARHRESVMSAWLGQVASHRHRPDEG